ncbi:hypothetical protein Glove_74g24 [Diversispora epigaea]|uniref:Uncharacterized protein n=1 Tax=Diversispora epigaea TaxID=1348612 RepID=A0A397JJW4_9GLOM|nr:hypothetical protein Glove_74g24 [Diversispora epigaea]
MCLEVRILEVSFFIYSCSFGYFFKFSNRSAFKYSPLKCNPLKYNLMGEIKVVDLLTTSTVISVINVGAVPVINVEVRS